MKEVLVLLFAVSTFSAHVLSQPVIEESGLGAAGTISGKVLIGGTVTPGDFGANQTWDFSTVALSQIGTMAFVNPSGTPYADSFPSSNYCLALDSAGIEQQYTYYIHSSGKLEIVGENITAASGYDYSPNPKTELEFPFQFLDSFTDDWQRTDDSSGTAVAIYDAFGTLTTPFGQFTNVVRLNYTDGVSQKYIWYSINPIYPIWTYIPADSASVAVNLNPVGITSDPEQDLLETIFPIPAHDQLNVWFSARIIADKVSVHLYDFAGSEVNLFSVSIKGPQLLALNIHQLLPGMYLLDVKLPRQHLLRKFVVE